MFHVVIHRSGPEYDLSRPLEEQSGWQGHADFMDELADAGFIVLGGPLVEAVGWRVIFLVQAPLCLAAMVVAIVMLPETDRGEAGRFDDEFRVVHAVEAESEEAVRATLARDPWSGSHLVVDTVEPWTIRLDSRLR